MTSKPYTAPNRQIYAWAIGGMASHMMIGIYGQAMNIFTVGFGLSAVIVGWAMMFPRVIDAILDPLLGHWSDDTHTRWGRRKPFMAASSLLGAIFIILLWWADRNWSEPMQLAYLLVLGTLCYICYGVYTMSWTALGYELTDDYNERSRVMAISGLFMTIVLLANGWIYWLALRPVFGGELTGIRWIAGAAALLVIGTAWITLLNCRERFTHANQRQHMPILPALKTTLRNRPFVIFLLYKLFQVFGERVNTGLLFYLGIYYVCSGDKSLATSITGIGATIGTIVGFALVPLMKPISARIGKKNGLVIAAAVAFVLAVTQPFILRPDFPYLMLLPTFVLLPLVLVANTLGGAIVPDICDLDELNTGMRREGLFTAVMGFVAKMEISLTVLIVGYLVSFSGFDAKLPTQPDAVLHKMLWLAVVPNVIFTFLTLLTAARFPLTEASMNEVRRQLDARHKVRPEESPLEEGAK
ncbi:MAG TPA: MFS transporter [Terrimicrobiaceae bacterium]|nr:MFS transporter [Terrimicrobiaceae bacterium]